MDKQNEAQRPTQKQGREEASEKKASRRCRKARSVFHGDQETGHTYKILWKTTKKYNGHIIWKKPVHTKSQ